MDVESKHGQVGRGEQELRSKVCNKMFDRAVYQVRRRIFGFDANRVRADDMG
jgi:hypothetical protein